MELPKFEVTLDGKSFEVQVTTADSIQWDMYRHKHGLPEMQEVSAIWSGRVTYTAAIREGQIDKKMPWEAYSAQVESVEYINNETVDPSNPDQQEIS